MIDPTTTAFWFRRNQSRIWHNQLIDRIGPQWRVGNQKYLNRTPKALKHQDPFPRHYGSPLTANRWLQWGGGGGYCKALLKVDTVRDSNARAGDNAKTPESHSQQIILVVMVCLPCPQASLMIEAVQRLMMNIHHEIVWQFLARIW